MKRLVFLALAMLLILPLSAQQKNAEAAGRSKHPSNEKIKIENMVKDLTATQKTRIDIVSRRSKKVIEDYRKELQSVRDSIHTLMESQEDHSETLFRLYDREGHLQSEISKEYYRAKRDIDAVLTPQQYQTLRNSVKRPVRHDMQSEKPSKN